MAWVLWWTGLLVFDLKPIFWPKKANIWTNFDLKNQSLDKIDFFFDKLKKKNDLSAKPALYRTKCACFGCIFSLQVLQEEHGNVLRIGREQRERTATAMGGASATSGRAPLWSSQRAIDSRSNIIYSSLIPSFYLDYLPPPTMLQF